MGVASSQPTTTDLTPRVQTLEGWVSPDQKYANELSFRQDTLSTTVFTQQSRLTTLGTTVDNLSIQNTALANRFEQYNLDFAVLADSVSTLSTNVIMLSDVLMGTGQVSDRVNTLSSLVYTYDRADMLGKIGSINTTAADTTTKVDTISANVWVLSGNIRSNTAAYGTISATVSNLGISYGVLNTRIGVISTNVSNLSLSVGYAYSSGLDYATKTNQMIANYIATFNTSMSNLSYLISTNAVTATNSINTLSLNMSNSIMSLSAYVAVLDGKVTNATASVPKLYTLSAPSKTADKTPLSYGLFIDPGSVPSGSIVYSQHAGNVNFLVGQFPDTTNSFGLLRSQTPGYTIYVVNYASSALAIATTWQAYDSGQQGLAFTGATQPKKFYTSPLVPDMSNSVTIPAGKTARFVYTAAGFWAVTFGA